MIKIHFLIALSLLFLWMVAACTASPQDTDVTPTPTPIMEETATAIPATPTTTTSNELDVDLDTFITQLQTAVTNQDYAIMETLMSDPIGVGPWRSQWQTLTPAQMIGQFQNSSLPAPFSVQFSNLSVDEITILLGDQPVQAMLGSDKNVVAVLHSNGWGQSTADDALLFVTEENGRYFWSAFLYTNGRFADANLQTTTAPVGLIYIIWGEGIYQIQADSSHRQIANAETANISNLKVSPNGRFAAYLSDDRQLWLIDNSSGAQTQLASESNLSNFLMWGDNTTLFTGVWLDPSEGDGPNNGHLAMININENGRSLQIVDEEHLLANHPAMARDLNTVAFDVTQAAQDDKLTSRLYHPDSGLTIFDPNSFNATNEMFDQNRFSPTWSPNGRLMTWFSSTGERMGLQLYDLEAKTATQIFDWDPARFGGSFPAPVWSPDGQWLALDVLANGPEGSGIWLFAVDGSSQTYINPQGHEPYWANETQLIFGLNDGPRLYDLASGETFKLDLPDSSWVLGVTPSADLSAWSNLSTSEENEVNADITYPDPADLTMTVATYPSPDGQWQATISQSEPVVISENVGEQYYVSLSVTDGRSAWTPIEEWRGYGLGYSWPTVHTWSPDGRFLYYTNDVSADGCALFVNGTDLYRLDTADGTITELLPANTTSNLSLAADETAVAYTQWNGETYNIAVRDLANGTEQAVAITEAGDNTQAGDIIWSADNTYLLLTIAHEPCNTEWTHSIVRVDVTAGGLTAVSLIEKDPNRFTIAEWSDPTLGIIQLQDKDGTTWLLNANSGEVAEE